MFSEFAGDDFTEAGRNDRKKSVKRVLELGSVGIYLYKVEF